MTFPIVTDAAALMLHAFMRRSDRRAATREIGREVGMQPAHAQRLLARWADAGILVREPRTRGGEAQFYVLDEGWMRELAPLVDARVAGIRSRAPSTGTSRTAVRRRG